MIKQYPEILMFLMGKIFQLSKKNVADQFLPIYSFYYFVTMCNYCSTLLSICGEEENKNSSNSTNTTETVCKSLEYSQNQ